MLIDDVEIIAEGGKGGPGRVAFYSKKGAGPSGGDGGGGGDVYIETTPDLYALNKFLAHQQCSAPNGEPGGLNRKSGANGKDLNLVVPVGTTLIDGEGKETELNSLNQKLLLAKGGLGGKGNAFFKSPSNTTPRYAQPGLKGEKKKLILKLKLIADFGLIGLPNAGKSSLLNELTNAQAKTGAYPFTTLEPNLGVLNGKVIADIPGLIEGASEGKGLGHKFLKHIEKVTLLLHCISSDSVKPLSDYKIIRDEIKRFSPRLLEKQEIILLTKSDLVEEKDLEKKIKALSETKSKIIPVSIHNWDSLQTLIQTILQK
ncbi:MAG: GTPase Obg [Microgenomates group bacterium Gr01-1014_7]|nr:MAG: GTPase Obg [Microgenomates group bacterium Gr01-1014_7]